MSRPLYRSLALVPSVVGRAVCEQPYRGTELIGGSSASVVAEVEAKRQAMTRTQIEAFAQAVDRRCRYWYAVSDSQFMNMVNAKDSSGRDQLYVWVNHWFAAWPSWELGFPASAGSWLPSNTVAEIAAGSVGNWMGPAWETFSWDPPASLGDPNRVALFKIPGNDTLTNESNGAVYQRELRDYERSRGRTVHYFTAAGGVGPECLLLALRVYAGNGRAVTPAFDRYVELRRSLEDRMFLDYEHYDALLAKKNEANIRQFGTEAAQSLGVILPRTWYRRSGDGSGSTRGWKIVTIVVPFRASTSFVVRSSPSAGWCLSE